MKKSKLGLWWDPFVRSRKCMSAKFTEEYKIWRGINWLIVSNLAWGIWRFLTLALKSLKDFHFNGLLLNKVYNFWAKKVQRIMSHDTVEWCNIWRKTDLWFGKWHEKFSEFLPGQSKLKTGTLMDLENVCA